MNSLSHFRRKSRVALFRDKAANAMQRKDPEK